MKNEHVKELLYILNVEKDSRLKELSAILGHISAMQNQLDTAVKELSAMRRDLAEAEKHNHPIQNVMRKAVIGMQAWVLDLRDKLAGLKQAVINGCKKVVKAFKEKGIAALDDIARFFKVKPILEAIRAGADKAEQAADRAINRIEAAGARYHEAGRNLKNVGRALSGKEDIQEAKPNGKMLSAFTVPYRAARASFSGIRTRVAAMVENLKRLEEKAAARKPRIKEVMRECSEKVSRKNQNAPKRGIPQASHEL